MEHLPFVEFGTAYPQDVGVQVLILPLPDATVFSDSYSPAHRLEGVHLHAEAEKNPDPGL